MDNLGIVLNCVDCGKAYHVSPNEQAWLKERNWELPKRCMPCRKQKKSINKFGDKPTAKSAV